MIAVSPQGFAEPDNLYAWQPSELKDFAYPNNGDDGWQSEIGDWLTFSGRFGSLPALADRIRRAGRRAGIWIAPFLAAANSEVVHDHPSWFAGDAGHNWDQDLLGLDIARAEDHLREVFGTLRACGFDYFKLDFLYAGALGGLDAYRHGWP